MGERIKKLKKIRIHREGTDELLYTLFALIAIAVILWRSFSNPIPFIIFMAAAPSAISTATQRRPSWLRPTERL